VPSALSRNITAACSVSGTRNLDARRRGYILYRAAASLTDPHGLHHGRDPPPPPRSHSRRASPPKRCRVRDGFGGFDRDGQWVKLGVCMHIPEPTAVVSDPFPVWRIKLWFSRSDYFGLTCFLLVDRRLTWWHDDSNSSSKSSRIYICVHATRQILGFDLQATLAEERSHNMKFRGLSLNPTDVCFFLVEVLEP
jgi:hypothetical protein